MKRLLTLLTAAALLLGLAACGAAPQSQDAETDSGAAETRIVTDVWNREVEIPAQVESIVCLGSMAPPLCRLSGRGGYDGGRGGYGY